jgi:hypothetical protein
MSQNIKIPRNKVKSSNIASVGYENGMMHVEFKNGGVYQYEGVSQKDHDDLINSKSIGSHLAKAIRPKFKAKKIVTTK